MKHNRQGGGWGPSRRLCFALELPSSLPFYACHTGYMLNMLNYCFIFLGELYCGSCHTRSFGTKGYGYGLGSGVLSTDTGKAGEVVSTAPKTSPLNTAGLGSGKNCPRCDQVVYDAEKVRAVGKVSEV